MGASPSSGAGDHSGDRLGESLLLAGVPDQIRWLVTRKIRLLSSADAGNLLLTRHGESGFSPSVVGTTLDDISPALAADALSLDPGLQAMRDRLVRPTAVRASTSTRSGPTASVMSDHSFWSHYLSHVDAVKHEVTLDYVRALSALQTTLEVRHALWVDLWRELELDERAQLRRAADVIARRALSREPEDGIDAAGEEYGQRGAYEVVRVVLATAITEGWHVRRGGGGGAAPRPATDRAPTGPAAEGSYLFGELLYRVWCCSEELVPPGAAVPSAPLVVRGPSLGAHLLSSAHSSPQGRGLASPHSPGWLNASPGKGGLGMISPRNLLAKGSRLRGGSPRSSAASTPLMPTPLYRVPLGQVAEAVEHSAAPLMPTPFYRLPSGQAAEAALEHSVAS
ncbi:hypothetical protein T492DRAFT_1085625 [Pavlovales sp. CCMP2436]|nr:hypothetical protein T492DRAFT_1085625 [Pavlovales sp. CCMP2436]